MKQNNFHIAIVGNPNCGKTTLFNALTGHQQKVGNWAGVTVEKKTGIFRSGAVNVDITDLPGVYSLSVADQCSALDERIACEYLLKAQLDLIINIVDASNLKRNLYLTRQLLEMQIPCIVALNMMDVAEKNDIKIDCQRLSGLLGCPVIPMSCNKQLGIHALKEVIDQFIYQPGQTAFMPTWPEAIEKVILSFSNQLKENKNKSWLAIRLLEKDSLAEFLVNDPDILKAAQHHIDSLESTLKEDSDIIFADCRYQWIENGIALCQQRLTTQVFSLSDKIDRLITHPWLGIPIFLLVMYFMFEFSMSIGTLLQPLFDISTQTIFVEGINYLGQILSLPVWLTAILANGIGVGINTVANFIPQIGLLFLVLTFLEDCGYMARAAFVMDRVMQVVGLPGKSFIPLIVGFGCNVPAIMATRTLDSQRDRIMTAMMMPFMSCGARLAIFVVFGSAFFPHHTGLAIFLLYLAGIFIALITGFILKHTLLRGRSVPFILEIPPYHFPIFKNLWIQSWQRLKGFVIRAGKMIIPICVLVGSLNSIQIPSHQAHSQNNKNSLLEIAGHTLTPLFAPMGITQNNWPATVGLLTGTLAKEVVVGTLNTLYTQNTQKAQTTGLVNSASFDFWGHLKSAWLTTLSGFSQVFSLQMLNPFTVTIADSNMTPSAISHMAFAFSNSWAAISYLLFVLLYIPCASTMAVMAREIGSRWALLSTFWSIDIAYSVAVCFYQLGQLKIHPDQALSWIFGIIMIQMFTFMMLRKITTGSTENKIKLISVNLTT